MRFPSPGVVLFVLVWAVVAAVPSLRHQTFMGASVIDNTLFGTPRLNVDEALKRSPNDPFLRSERLQQDWWENGPDTKDKAAHFFQGFDELIAKHPTHLELWRTRLLFSTRGSIVNETHTIKNLREQGATQTPKPLVPTAHIWLTKPQLQQLCNQAHRAGQLAPNDAFFPLIEAMALSGLNREKEAISTLQRAGNCSTFNDGTWDLMRQKLAFLKSQGPVDWDEEMLVGWEMLLPHFSGMRAIIREVAYSAADEYKAGHKAEAWRRWGIALRAARIIRTGSSQGPQGSYIGILVGEANESITWNITCQAVSGFNAEKEEKKTRKIPGKPDSQKIVRLRATEFARLARLEGQQDLAELTKSEIAAIDGRHKQRLLRGDMNLYDKFMGWKTPLAAATVQIRWFGWKTLMLAGCGAFGLILSVLMTRGGRETKIKRSTVLNMSMFFIALWLGVEIWALRQGAGAGNLRTLLSLQATDTSPFSGPGRYDWNEDFWSFLRWTLLAIWFFHWWLRRWEKKEFGTTQTLAPSIWQVFCVGMWVIALVPSFFLWVDGLSFDLASPNIFFLFPIWMITVAVALFLTGKAGGRRHIQFGYCAALGLFSSILLTRQHYDPALFLGFFTGLATLFALAWNLRGTWNGFQAFFFSFRAPLELGGRVTANLALALSVTYLLASLALIPQRQKLNQGVDEYMRLGEVEWMRAHQ